MNVSQTKGSSILFPALSPESNIITDEHFDRVVEQLKGEWSISAAYEQLKQVNDLTDDQQDAALAQYVAHRKVTVAQLYSLIGKEKLFSMAHHLRYVDLRSLHDSDMVEWALELLRGCPKVEQLLISSSRITELSEGLSQLQTLNCSGCHNLTTLPQDLSQLKVLNCSYCQKLKTLPKEFLSLQELTCGKCPSLTVLPEVLPKLRGLYCYDCPKIAILSKKLPELLWLNCLGCHAITELPEGLSQLLELNCAHCLELRTLPTGLSQLQKILCYQCHNLTTLPDDLTQLQRLYCSGCQRLTLLPEGLLQLQHLECNYCPALTSLSYALPSLQELHCRNSPNITVTTEMPATVRIFSDETARSRYERWKVELTATDKEGKTSSYYRFTKSAKLLLSEIGERYLLQKKDLPNVDYVVDGESSIAIDRGGVRRDFITRLCEHLFDKNALTGSQKLSEGGVLPKMVSADEEVAYLTLGALMALCYAPSSHYKMGLSFLDPIVYTALTALNDPLAPSDRWLAAALALVQGINANISSAIGHLVVTTEEKLQNILVTDAAFLTKEKADKRMRAIIETAAYLIDGEKAYDNTTYLQDPVAYVVANRARLIDIARSDGQLRAIAFIALGMLQYLGTDQWQKLCGQGAQQLQEAVEGTLTAQDLLNKLSWGYCPAEKAYFDTAQFLKRWIRNDATPQQLRTFVRCITGSASLGAGTPLRINLYTPPGDRLPIAHACVFSLELPANYRDYAHFKGHFELFLKESIAGSGFSLA